MRDIILHRHELLLYLFLVLLVRLDDFETVDFFGIDDVLTLEVLVVDEALFTAVFLEDEDDVADDLPRSAN